MDAELHSDAKTIFLNADFKLDKITPGSSEDLDSDFHANTAAFEALDRDFHDVITQLMGDSSLEKFRLEYEKLHRALKKSHDQEKRLVKKCRELNTEILNNQAKIKTALRLSQDDQTTIANLQKEMEKTWKLVYVSQEKETRATETVNALKEEMINLTALLEQGALEGADHEVVMRSLRQTNDDLQIQVTGQSSRLIDYERTIQHYQRVNAEMQSQLESKNLDVDNLNETLASKDKELSQQLKKKDRLQREYEEVHAAYEDGKRVIDRLNSDLKASKSHVADLHQQLKESKHMAQKHLKDFETLYYKSNKMAEDLEVQMLRNKEKRAECLVLENELKQSTQDNARILAERTLWERKYEKEHRDVNHYKEMADASKVPLMIAQTEVDGLKSEIMGLNKAVTELSRKHELVVKDKERQMTATERAEQRVKEKEDLIHEHSVMRNELATEIAVFKDEVSSLRKTIAATERDRERLAGEVATQRERYLSADEEVRSRDVHINDMLSKVQELECKLKHQLHLYEALRMEKNEAVKSLKESNDELSELRKSVSTLTHQANQLKDELDLKEQQISRDEFEIAKVEKVKESLQTELSRKNQLLTADHELVDSYIAEISQLTSTIRKLDESLLNQKREYDKLINERDVIGLQLIRRNDEITLLTERIQLQNSGLRTGEAQYYERLKDIELLKAKVRDLIRETSLTKNSGAKISEMKLRIHRLERELLQEKGRVKALSEELETPLNIHRWRKLEGSDPCSYELIQKVQVLQKRLILKTEEVVEMALRMQDKDKVMREMKDVMSRQPGPEVGEQINVYQKNLRDKTSRMKALAGELNMYQAHASEYKYEIERLTRELTELKRKYYQQKRRNGDMTLTTMSVQRDEMSSPGTNLQQLTPNNGINCIAGRTKYAGGGFAIKSPLS